MSRAAETRRPIRAVSTLMATALTALTGCQSDAYVRSQPPLDTFRSTKSLDAAVTCLIPSLGAAYSKAAISNFRFVGQVISPGAEYDIVPTDAFVNGHYAFTVNVKKDLSGSTISLYKGQFMLPKLTAAMVEGINQCL